MYRSDRSDAVKKEQSPVHVISKRDGYLRLVSSDGSRSDI